MTPAFRSASISDLPFILSVESACFRMADRFSARQVRRFLKNPCQSIRVVILTDGGIPAGWAVLFTRRGSRVARLYSIAVHPDFSGRGLAKACIQHFSRRLSGGFSALVLEVRRSNSRALRLYRSLGFRAVRVLPGYYPGGEAGVKLRLDLPNGPARRNMKRHEPD